MAKYLVPASLLLSQSMAAASLFDSYVSLSFELIGFPTFAGKHTFAICINIQEVWMWTDSYVYTGTKSHPNAFSHNLMQNLAELQGSGIVTRIGGNSG